MTGDLLVITPSRGRPQSVARLLDAVHQTATAVTHVHVGVDDDDPQRGAYEDVWQVHAGPGDHLSVNSRAGLAEWTNRITVSRKGEYRYLASLGDDHVPRTKGWDAALIRAIEDMGGTGFAYPWDGTREDVAEAVVMSSDIVRALGWMANPACGHFYIDDTWTALGRAAGCLRHCRAVWVEHVHPVTGKVAPDATNAEQGRGIPADKAAYLQWRQERMAADVAAVRSLREPVPAPA